MNGFNEMNYHQIKSRENFLFLCFPLRHLLKVFRWGNVRGMWEEVYIGERGKVEGMADRRERTVRNWEEIYENREKILKISLSSHLRWNLKENPHEIVNCSMICLMYKLQVRYSYFMYMCETHKQSHNAWDKYVFLRDDGFSGFLNNWCSRGKGNPKNGVEGRKEDILLLL